MDEQCLILNMTLTKGTITFFKILALVLFKKKMDAMIKYLIDILRLRFEKFHCYMKKKIFIFPRPENLSSLKYYIYFQVSLKHSVKLEKLCMSGFINITPYFLLLY